MEGIRHKKIKFFDEDINVGVQLKNGSNIKFHREEILNAGKINHEIHGSFEVKQKGISTQTIKFHILNDFQVTRWAGSKSFHSSSIFQNRMKKNTTDPKKFLHSSLDAIPKGDFNVKLDKENIIYFVFDNSISLTSSKTIHLEIFEEWDEKIKELDVVTTIPPHDTSLNDDVNSMIMSAKSNIKIISPHVDMSLIKELLEKHENGVTIQIITQNRDSFSGKNKVSAYDNLQKLEENHKNNNLVHSRLIIIDDLEAIVSSADLTNDSMRAQFNAGIELSSPEVIQKLLNFFNQVWRESKNHKESQ